jgi:hypothetical protein
MRRTADPDAGAWAGRGFTKPGPEPEVPHTPRYWESYKVGLRHAQTGELRLICGTSPESDQEYAGYWAGRAAGERQLAGRKHEREAEPEPGT